VYADQHVDPAVDQIEWEVHVDRLNRLGKVDMLILRGNQPRVADFQPFSTTLHLLVEPKAAREIAASLAAFADAVEASQTKADEASTAHPEGATPTTPTTPTTTTDEEFFDGIFDV
jgi:hypothetical protein